MGERSAVGRKSGKEGKLTEAGREALPLNDPVRLCSPSILVDVEGELCRQDDQPSCSRPLASAPLTVVAEQELSVDAVDGDRPSVLALLHKVEGRIGRVEQALGIQRLEIDNLEALGAADAELGLEEVDRTRLGGDVELLRKDENQEWLSRREKRQ